MNSIRHIRERSEDLIERNEDLINAYLKKLKSLGKNSPYVSKADIISSVISSSAPRFYCSLEEAHRNCSKLSRGIPLTRKCSSNEKMYIDLCAKAIEYKEKTGVKSLKAALAEVIYSEAPEFYICEAYAMRIINKSHK